MDIIRTDGPNVVNVWLPIEGHFNFCCWLATVVLNDQLSGLDIRGSWNRRSYGHSRGRGRWRWWRVLFCRDRRRRGHTLYEKRETIRRTPYKLCPCAEKIKYPCRDERKRQRNNLFLKLRKELHYGFPLPHYPEEPVAFGGGFLSGSLDMGPGTHVLAGSRAAGFVRRKTNGGSGECHQLIMFVASDVEALLALRSSVMLEFAVFATAVRASITGAGAFEDFKFSIRPGIVPMVLASCWI
jgi:hypothetical protein